ncbi:unnamed protein product [Brachionus calyciflorus]|uniref:Snake toxin/toxin-like domain-containing protein n=1 Tax=Brachionus calyciflorus TaxID=104777 RepID=A0A814J0L7_9BILA|nr:unnamed protein product [Brachionus calyciflorus]
MTIKKFSIVFVILSCLILRNSALKCYTCSNCDGSTYATEDLILKECPIDFRFCQTLVAESLKLKTIIKFCSYECRNVTEHTTLTHYYTNCCSTDGCNLSSTDFINSFADRKKLNFNFALLLFFLYFLF